MTYNLSIFCVDSTIYACSSRDKKQLKDFLLKYDHEGSSISLVKVVKEEDHAEIDFGYDSEAIYAELA